MAARGRAGILDDHEPKVGSAWLEPCSGDPDRNLLTGLLDSLLVCDNCYTYVNAIQLGGNLCRPRLTIYGSPCT
jgi:hypothetical protein